jgi:hypothetical protein
MKALTIKDLALDKELSGEAMSAVHGGIGNQANATQQGNTMALFAPVSVGNGFFGGPAIIQVDSNPTQSASNYSSSSNESFKGFGCAY